MDLLQRVPLCQLSRLTTFAWVVESVAIERRALFCQSCFFPKNKSDFLLCARQTIADLQKGGSSSKWQNVYPQYYSQRRHQRSGLWFLNTENNQNGFTASSSQTNWVSKCKKQQCIFLNISNISTSNMMQIGTGLVLQCNLVFCKYKSEEIIICN